MSLSARRLSIREFGHRICHSFMVCACVVGFVQYLSLKSATRITAHLDGKPIEAPLIIDGRRMGTTPYAGSLPIGMHTIWVLPPDGLATSERQFEFEVASIVSGFMLDANFHLDPTVKAARPPDTHSPR